METRNHEVSPRCYHSFFMKPVVSTEHFLCPFDNFLRMTRVQVNIYSPKDYNWNLRNKKKILFQGAMASSSTKTLGKVLHHLGVGGEDPPS